MFRLITFSATGQRWGNPLYRWDVLQDRGFEWWVQRIRRARQLYDIVRLDHFRGFEAYWSIPASDETAIHGEWIKAPGLALFQALEARSARCHWSRKTSASSLRKSTRCASKWACRA